MQTQADRLRVDALTRRLETVNAKLEKLPAYRRQTRWHASLLSEQAGIIAQIERIKSHQTAE
jgi:cell division protein FtsB